MAHLGISNRSYEAVLQTSALRLGSEVPWKLYLIISEEGMTERF